MPNRDVETNTGDTARTFADAQSDALEIIEADNADVVVVAALHDIESDERETFAKFASRGYPYPMEANAHTELLATLIETFAKEINHTPKEVAALVLHAARNAQTLEATNE